MKLRHHVKFVSFQEMHPSFRSKTVKLFHAKRKRLTASARAEDAAHSISNDEIVEEISKVNI